MLALGEERWVAAARNGSELAFARLVQLHQSGVRSFLRRILSAGWAEADDIAQETFLAAWSSLSSLKTDQGFRPWIMGIAWRRAQDRIRRSRRSAARDGSWLDQAELPQGVSAEDRMAMQSAMSDLAPDVRACVALCLAGGWSHSEAAEVLGLPLGTVKSHVVRGRAKLLLSLGGVDDR